jgi:two-component system CheB/CheR fusion protein
LPKRTGPKKNKKTQRQDAARLRSSPAARLQEPGTRRHADTAPRRSADRFLIVAIGASAGGIEAFEAFFRAMPARNGVGFVVLAHLDPKRESLLPSILSRWTEMPVAAARDGDRVIREKVFVIPANSMMTIADGRLRLRKRQSASERMPLDVFFASLAEDQGECAVSIVLSGSGSDGTLGSKAVKEHGGLTLAQGQDGSEARFKEMPESAASTGLVDLVIPVEDMPGRLLAYARSGGFGETATARGSTATGQIYSLMRSRVGHDFSRYKERTFLRRVYRRMQVLQLSQLEDYVTRLQQDRGEAPLLLRDLLIGVTHFFRDREAFETLEKFIPRLFEGKGADDSVRVWVPACATGEEAYSIAMLLREHADRLPAAPTIQVFASDIDDNALAVARNARYPAMLVKDIRPERLKRFFVQEGATYHVARDIRDLCVFSTHSLIRDPPFSRLDLISCRNLLIYFNVDLQAQIIPLFHYALRPGGLLLLGSSENVSRHEELFSSLDKRGRIFERQNLVARSLAAFPTAGGSLGGRKSEPGRLLPGLAPSDGDTALGTLLRRVSAIIAENFAPAYVVANKEGEVVYYSSRTGAYLEAAEGPPNRDLLVMARKGLRVDLRAALHRARESGDTVTVENGAVQVNGGSQRVRLTVMPVSESGETLYVVLFTDLAPLATADGKPETPPGDIEDGTIQQLERELRTTKERLQSTVEEFETSGEELKSSNEELLSVNEELQSANEELETSKEEIQSINEELQTVNAELSSKVEELDRANADLKNLFDSTQVATIILDQDLRIRSFTPAIENIFNLILSDRGRPLGDIVSRLDGRDIHRDLRTAIERGTVVERRVTAQDGNFHYLMRILPYRMLDKQMKGALITFVDISNVIRAEKREKILISELNQGVKNMLGAVVSIATNTLKRSTTLEGFSTDLLERIRALARTQETLSEANWAETPIRHLIAAELELYAAESSRKTSIDGPDILLMPKAALALGVALHELAAHAAKHGGFATPAGRVRVEWALTGKGRQMLSLTWTERGGPPVPTQKKKSGSGLDFIERGLRLASGGSATLEFRRAGLRCTIQIPAASSTEPPKGANGGGSHSA